MRNDNGLFNRLHLIVNALHTVYSEAMVLSDGASSPQRRWPALVAAQVNPRAEITPGCLNQHDLEMRRLPEAIQRRCEELHHPASYRIELLRPIERCNQERALLLYQQV